MNKKIFRTNDFDPKKVMGVDDLNDTIINKIYRQFARESLGGRVEIDDIHEVFKFNTPSLLEKWAEEDLNSGVQYRLFDQHRLYSIIGDGGFMDD